MKNIAKVSLPLALVVGLAGCDEGDDGRPTYPSWDQTILELAAAESDLSTFAELVDLAGLNEAYGGTTSVYTVFAPTNAAFSALSNIDELRDPDNQAALSELLRFHTSGGKLASPLVTISTEYETLTSTTVNIRVSGDTITLSNSQGTSATLTRVDLNASNGVIHVIDAVLTPPPPPVEPLGTIVEVATDAGGFDTLLGAAAGVGLDTRLSGAGPFTLFAPTDAAFMALGDISGVDSGVIQNILMTHVVDGSNDSAAVAGAADFTTLAKTTIPVDASGMPITIGGAALSETVDVMADNGVIHAMDAVIVPPTIVEIVNNTADLSDLMAAVTKTSTSIPMGALEPDTLAGDTPLTVFAPTNAAFMAAGIDVAMTGTSTLASVLSHHVVSGQWASGDLTDGQVVTTVNGDITINVAADGSVTVTDGQGNMVNVVMADIRTLTGVVHLIDGVLLP